MGQAEMTAKLRNVTRDTVRGYSPAVVRERVLFPWMKYDTTLVYDSDGDIGVYIYQFTNSHTLVHVADHQTDEGWWIWSGCSCDEVMEYCRTMYNVSDGS
jgi:hypothetical protein